jgi:demethylmenaquinone methyltransferase / 2-methoxy-6-polyprenyl-1,4-benzoquinol methylase
MQNTSKLLEVPKGSGAMFDRIAWRYDMLNRLLSFGMDTLWRRRLVDNLQVRGNMRVLDIATGTGDVALAIAKRSAGVFVTGVDPSTRMLALGQQKINERGLEKRIHLVEGDALALPFSAHRFDACSMAFGIRNVADRAHCLREMIRVTRSGGRIAILELGEPSGSFFSPLARIHVHYLLPLLGRLLVGGEEYNYLQQSMAAFPPPKQFLQSMQEAGLAQVQLTRFAFGAANLFVGSTR